MNNVTFNKINASTWEIIRDEICVGTLWSHRLSSRVVNYFVQIIGEGEEMCFPVSDYMSARAALTAAKSYALTAAKSNKPMTYADFYGSQIKGTAICADHRRLLDLFDPLYMVVYSDDYQNREEGQTTLDALFTASMRALVSAAREEGDKHLVPNRDYGLFRCADERKKIVEDARRKLKLEDAPRTTQTRDTMNSEIHRIMSHYMTINDVDQIAVQAEIDQMSDDLFNTLAYSGIESLYGRLSEIDLARFDCAPPLRAVVAAICQRDRQQREMRELRDLIMNQLKQHAPRR